MYSPGLDIVVTNYRTPHDLADFAQSVQDNPPHVAYSLTVVNVSPQQPDKAVAEHIHTNTLFRQNFLGYEHLTYVDNVGYAQACNAGALKGARSVVALFNADVRLTPHALDECYAALTHHTDWGVLGPRQVNDEGRMTHAGIFGSQSDPLHRGWQAGDSPAYASAEEAVTVSGAAYFIKRELWDLLAQCPLYQDVAPRAEGAFLPTSHYYEETWCSYHAAAHGWKVIYYGPVRIVHHWHKASPIGGWAEQQVPLSREYFREACDHHSIPHD